MKASDFLDSNTPAPKMRAAAFLDAPDDGFLEKVANTAIGRAVGGGIDKIGKAGADVLTGKTNPLYAALGVGAGSIQTATGLPIGVAGSAFQALPDLGVTKTIGEAGRAVRGGISDALDSTGAGQAIGDYLMNNPKAADFMNRTGQAAKDAAIVTAFNPSAFIKGGNLATQATQQGIEAVKKFENISANAPSILGDTGSGVSTNAALLGAPDAVGQRVKGFKALSGDDLKALVESEGDKVTQAYSAVDKTGTVVNSTSTNSLLNKIGTKLQETDLDPEFQPKTLAALRVLKGNVDSDVGGVGQISLGKLDQFRRLLGRATAPEDRMAAAQLRELLNEHLQNIKGGDLANGSIQAIDALDRARSVAARTFTVEKIADMIEKANGNDNAIRKAFTKFVQDDKNLRGLSSEEIAAFKNASKNTGGQAIEKFIGRFGIDGSGGVLPTFAATVGAAGGSVLFPAAAPAVAVGSVAKYTRKLAARGDAQKALETVLNRPLREARPAEPPPPQRLLPAPDYRAPMTESQVASAREAMMRGVSTKPSPNTPYDYGDVPYNYIGIPSFRDVVKMPPAEQKAALNEIFQEAKRKSAMQNGGAKVELQTRIKQLGGVNDFKAELDMLDAKSLANSKGKSLDRIRETLVEEGYGNYDTVNDLLDAIDNSNRGNKIYTDPDTLLDKAERGKQALQSDPVYIEYQASRMGIDTNGKSKAKLIKEIKKAIDEQDIPF
jgi:hypothetical protein